MYVFIHLLLHIVASCMLIQAPHSDVTRLSLSRSSSTRRARSQYEAMTVSRWELVLLIMLWNWLFKLLALIWGKKTSDSAKIIRQVFIYSPLCFVYVITHCWLLPQIWVIFSAGQKQSWWLSCQPLLSSEQLLYVLYFPISSSTFENKKKKLKLRERKLQMNLKDQNISSDSFICLNLLNLTKVQREIFADFTKFIVFC